MRNAESRSPAGIGSRGVAMAIDAFVWFTLFFVATFLVATFTGEVVSSSTGVDADLTGTPALVALVLWLGLSIGYHTVLEWRYGKTIGKQLVNLRVARDDGSSLTLGSSLVRNVLRLADFLPLFYVFGIVLIVLSGRNQRLGDRVGNTVVVRT
ncbi:RDD family protein [Halorussus aquaticus]|uniref:RDD family protein n=1 Tax=Halorussus aquaticus TaxID=2953748 RepID=A0ABD5PXV1_9EURY|nr:RDD family protein [Halorussus aquaticus]